MATIEQIALSKEGRKDIVRFCSEWKWPMPDGEMQETCSGDIYDRVRELPQDIRQLFFADYDVVKPKIDEYIEKEETCLVNRVEPSFPLTYREAVFRRATVIAKYKPQSHPVLEDKRKKVIFALALRDLLRNYC